MIFQKMTRHKERPDILRYQHPIVIYCHFHKKFITNEQKACIPPVTPVSIHIVDRHKCFLLVPLGLPNLCQQARTLNWIRKVGGNRRIGKYIFTYKPLRQKQSSQPWWCRDSLTARATILDYWD